MNSNDQDRNKADPHVRLAGPNRYVLGFKRLIDACDRVYYTDVGACCDPDSSAVPVLLRSGYKPPPREDASSFVTRTGLSEFAGN